MEETPPVVEPIEVVATTLPVRRPYVMNRPGHIAIASPNGNFPGCKLLHVTAQVNNWDDGIDPTIDAKIREALGVEEGEGVNPVAYVNEFFRQQGGLLVVDLHVHPNGAVSVLYTNQLEGEELEEFQEFSHTVSAHMQEWRRKRDEAKAEEEQKKLRAMDDARELIEMGKKAKEHNLFAKLRDLEAKLKDMTEWKAALKLEANTDSPKKRKGGR